MPSLLDIEDPRQLTAYLRQAGHWRGGTPRLTTLAGGVSNRTVRVEWPDGGAWVIKQALEKLRVQVDWYSSPERIHREALGLRWLAMLAPPGTITPLVFEDFDAHLLAMQAVPDPHANWKQDLLAGRLEPGSVAQFGRLLGAIHRESARRRDEVAAAFDDRSFFVSLRLEPYYEYTAARVPEAAAFYAALIDETLACREALVHGDYSPKNILVHAGRLVLLDHEVIHYGDPAFDLGFSLAHLLSKAHHLPALRTAFAAAARLYWATYREQAGERAGGLEGRAARHTAACLLARVAGRSPLEYLSPAERARQQAATLTLMADPPAAVPDLIDRFTRQLE